MNGSRVYNWSIKRRLAAEPFIPMTQVFATALAIIGVMSFSPQQDSKEAAFWRWFRANESRLFDFEKDRERVFDELQGQLHAVQSDLTFEFGPKQDGKREFVISADGIRKAFPAVVSLADAVPMLPRWKITKFRPRRNFQSPVTLNGLSISPEQVKFTMERDGDRVGITLFIEGYNPAEHLKYASVVYLMLDQALGEYDVETKVGFIEFRSNAVPSKLTKQVLSELVPSFDRLIKPGAGGDQ
jgi:hypothetical protein